MRVFFELNGQPRIAKVPDRAAVAKLPARRKAEEGNDAHVAAPMPGSITTVAVRPGQKVEAGDVLLTIEAMKMETVLYVQKFGVVAEVLVHPTQSVDARTCLLYSRDGNKNCSIASFEADHELRISLTTASP